MWVLNSMENGVHNKIGSFTGIAGFLVSLIALYISYQGSLDRKENLRLSMNIQRHGYEATVKPPVADIIPALISTKWDVVITNTSDRPTTILDREIYLVGENGRKEYSGMDQGVYTTNGERLSLPVSIDPGKHIKLLAVIGYEISMPAYNLLNKTYDLSSPQLIDSMQQDLCKHGIDFKGNEAQCSDGLMTVQSSPTDNLYIFKVSTARDNNFDTAGFWYKAHTTY